MEELDVLAFTRLADTQQDQAIVESPLRGRPLDHAPLRCKCLYCVLSVIVVPWDTVEFQEREHLVAVLLQALDDFLAASLVPGNRARRL